MGSKMKSYKKSFKLGEKSHRIWKSCKTGNWSSDNEDTQVLATVVGKAPGEHQDFSRNCKLSRKDLCHGKDSWRFLRRKEGLPRRKRLPQD